MSASSPQHGTALSVNSGDDQAAGASGAATDSPSTGLVLLRRPAMIGGCIAIGVLAWFTLAPQTAELRAVQNGRRFSTAERRQAEHALHSAGITDLRAAGSQLLVPPEALADSDAALEQTAHKSESSAEQWQSANQLLDQFATGRHQQQADAAARAAQIGRLLKQLPGVESAEIVWDEEPRIGRRQPPRVRATVFLKPEAGCTIGLDTVHAVRTAVAGSRAHLAPSDVAVMDLQRMVTHRADLDADAFAEEVRRAAAIAACRTHLAAALEGIAGVHIAVELLPQLRSENPVGAPVTGVVASSMNSRSPYERFAGRSGPNLRLEVAQSPAVAAPQRAVAENATRVDVAIIVPAAHVAAHAARLADSQTTPHVSRDVETFREHVRHAVEADVRQRLTTALAGLPANVVPSQLSIRLESPSTEQWPTVPATAVNPGMSVNWSQLQSLARSPAIRSGAVVGCVFASILFVAWRIVRWRRRRVLAGIGTARVSFTNGGITLPAHHNAARTIVAAPPHARQPATDPFLPHADVADWAPILVREPVTVIAGVLPRLSPDEVAHVMLHLTPALQREVLELAPTADLDEHSLCAVRRRLRSTILPAPRPATAVSPPGSLTVSFDDLARVDDASLELLAGRVHPETWSAALIGATPKLQRRLSKMNRDTGLLRGRQDRRPLRLREIEAAQRLIVDEWRTLQSVGVPPSAG